MRELTELENWLLAIAGRADPIRDASAKLGMTLPHALLQRSELKAILESANEGWGSKEDHELDMALAFLGESGLIENFDPLAQRPEGRQHKQLVELAQRVEALERRRGVTAKKPFDVYMAFRITGQGQFKLSEIAAANQEELTDA